MQTRTATGWRWLVAFACLLVGFSSALYVSLRIARTDKTVIGHVLDNGRPVAGATVYVQTFRIPGAAVMLQRTHSQADGSFKFSVANWHEECEVGAWVKGKQVGVFSIKPDDPLYGGSLQDIPVVVRLRPATRVKLRVVDSNGKPVSGVPVGPTIILAAMNVFRPIPSVLRELGTLTDSDGRANIDSLPCVSYSGLGVDDSRFALVKKLVTTPATSEVKIVVQPACHLLGKVTIADRPKRGMVLLWHSGDRKVDDWAETDNQGVFRIDRAPKGPITIGSATTGSLADDYPLPKTQAVANPNSVGRMDIHLEPGTLVTFKVLDPSGKPVAKGRVSGQLANPPAGPGNMATAEVLGTWQAPSTDQNGITRVRLKPEQYMVLASQGGTSFGKSQYAFVGDVPVQQVQLRTPPAESQDVLSFKVIDAEGYPVRTLVWFGYENKRTGKQGTGPLWTGQDGVTIPGQRLQGMRVCQIRAQIGDEFSDLVVPPKNGLVVLKLHHVKLGSVAGAVTDASGRPIEGAELRLDPNSTVPAPTNVDICPTEFKTGPDGKFEFNGILPEFETFYVVHAPGYEDSRTADFTVVAGKTVRLPKVVLSRVQQ